MGRVSVVSTGHVPLVIFMSRTAVAQYQPPSDAVLVAIRNPRNEQLSLPGWRDILHLDFHDIDGPYEDFQLFSWTQAFQVCDFVKRHMQCALIAAHCDYGVSRSAAVALFASRLTGARLEGDFGGCNKLVLSRLRAAWAWRSTCSGRPIQAWRDFNACRVKQRPD